MRDATLKHKTWRTYISATFEGTGGADIFSEGQGVEEAQLYRATKACFN
jgi:hypothetical protein